MTIWEWIYDFGQQALRAGDAQRVRLTTIHSEAYEHRQTDPDRMLSMLNEGRRLAQALREPWFVAFFDHWINETYIYYKDDYREVIDQAVRLTLEIRKPAFDQFPLRFGIYCNLVAAYLCVDPRGYARPIRDALDYLGGLVPPEGGDRYLLQARRHWFALELGEFEEANRLALEELDMADGDPDRHTARHHEVDTLKALCWIAFRRNDFDALAGHAALGEECAREMQYRYELAQFILWRAMLARRVGDDDARRLCRQATHQMARLGQPPGESYYDALAAYHAAGGDLAAAWPVRERELATSIGKGQLAYEAQVRIKRVRLLRRLGRDATQEEAAAREAIAKVREPGWYLGELEKGEGR
jgi:hypothetical protein